MTNKDPELNRLKVFYGSSVLALRVSALVNILLIAAIGLLSYNLYAIHAQIRAWKPLVIRVNQAGNATPVDLVVDNDPATDLEVKVFCAQYIDNIQSFDAYALNRDVGLALDCTDQACAHQLLQYFQTDPQLQKYRQLHTTIQCTVNAVQILRSNPYEVRVDYTLTNMDSQQKRTWFALLTLKPSQRSFRNPFGLLVTGIRINTTVS